MTVAKAEPGTRLVRTRNSEQARKDILEAAEAVFAEHGFDGARVEAIAKLSGYNVSLLFQYFGDKLGLYSAVLRRANTETTDFQRELLTPILADETLAMQAGAFRALLETAVQTVFDYLVQHPRLLRILTWEMAAGWQRYADIASQLPAGESEPFEAVFQRAWRAGLLRSDFSNTIQLTLIFQVCQTYLAFRPMYQAMLPGEDLSSSRSLSRAREFLVEFIVGGMLVDGAPAQRDTRLTTGKK